MAAAKSPLKPERLIPLISQEINLLVRAHQVDDLVREGLPTLVCRVKVQRLWNADLSEARLVDYKRVNHVVGLQQPHLEQVKVGPKRHKVDDGHGSTAPSAGECIGISKLRAVEPKLIGSCKLTQRHGRRGGDPWPELLHEVCVQRCRDVLPWHAVQQLSEVPVGAVTMDLHGVARRRARM
eukprot:2640985-Prymnesium_polylepis.2